MNTTDTLETADSAGQPPEGLAPKPCSLLVECEEDVQEFRARKPHNRFFVWKGRDGWHKKLSVQIRLEPSGDVYLSTQEGHVSTLRSATITIERLHALILGVTANAQDQTREPKTSI